MVLNALELESAEEFLPQNDGEISDSITQNWTQQAIECYSLRCNCAKCSLADGNYSFVCQMPKVLTALRNTLGEPSQKVRLKCVK